MAITYTDVNPGRRFPWGLALAMYTADSAKHVKSYQDLCRYYDEERVWVNDNEQCSKSEFYKVCIDS